MKYTRYFYITNGNWNFIFILFQLLLLCIYLRFSWLKLNNSNCFIAHIALFYWLTIQTLSKSASFVVTGRLLVEFSKNAKWVAINIVKQKIINNLNDYIGFLIKYLQRAKKSPNNFARRPSRFFNIFTYYKNKIQSNIEPLFESQLKIMHIEVTFIPKGF